MSDQTNLADLLALNLHKFEDEVRNIVDKATKELSMEKTLKVSVYNVCIMCIHLQRYTAEIMQCCLCLIINSH